MVCPDFVIPPGYAVIVQIDLPDSADVLEAAFLHMDFHRLRFLGLIPMYADDVVRFVVEVGRIAYVVWSGSLAPVLLLYLLRMRHKPHVRVVGARKVDNP